MPISVERSAEAECKFHSRDLARYCRARASVSSASKKSPGSFYSDNPAAGDPDRDGIDHTSVQKPGCSVRDGNTPGNPGDAYLQRREHSGMAMERRYGASGGAPLLEATRGRAGRHPGP